MRTCACFNPISGRVYQLYSTKWVFVGSIVIFEVGSAICGAAPNSTAFIIGRAIAGLASAFVFSGGIMLTLPLVPPTKRPVVQSMLGIAMGISSVVSPVLQNPVAGEPVVFLVVKEQSFRSLPLAFYSFWLCRDRF